MKMDYKKRNTTILKIENPIINLKNHNIEDILINYKTANKEYYFDIGSFCYTNYKKAPKENMVILESLDKSRIKYIQILLEKFIALDAGPSVKNEIYLEFHYFIYFYNNFHRKLKFSKNNLKETYIKYIKCNRNLKSINNKQYIISYMLSLLLDEYFENILKLTNFNDKNYQPPIHLQHISKSIFTYRKTTIIYTKNQEEITLNKNISINELVYIVQSNNLEYQLDIGSLTYINRLKSNNFKTGEIHNGYKVDVNSFSTERVKIIESFNKLFIHLSSSNKARLQFFRAIKNFIDYIDNILNESNSLLDEKKLLSILMKYLKAFYSKEELTRHKITNIKFICYFISEISLYSLDHLYKVLDLDLDNKYQSSKLYISSNKELSYRPVIILDFIDLPNLNKLPEVTKIIIRFKYKNRNRYFDLGALCYKERIKRSGCQSDKLTKITNDAKRFF